MVTFLMSEIDQGCIFKSCLVDCITSLLKSKCKVVHFDSARQIVKSFLTCFSLGRKEKDKGPAYNVFNCIQIITGYWGEQVKIITF